ncbi:hypothetical protein VP01_1087g1 [Puccinia sorghi]|uniref:Uncharacterized protein n=1 Tax=Puccinia sorghi TaxID=27349 RepID=A0A0L6VT63_9BASI|nr:hypothetical protein VP01_1087g1 [Puccinia sorghi]
MIKILLNPFIVHGKNQLPSFFINAFFLRYILDKPFNKNPAQLKTIFSDLMWLTNIFGQNNVPEKAVYWLLVRKEFKVYTRMKFFLVRYDGIVSHIIHTKMIKITSKIFLPSILTFLIYSFSGLINMILLNFQLSSSIPFPFLSLSYIICYSLIDLNPYLSILFQLNDLTQCGCSCFGVLKSCVLFFIIGKQILAHLYLLFVFLLNHNLKILQLDYIFSSPKILTESEFNSQLNCSPDDMFFTTFLWLLADEEHDFFIQKPETIGAEFQILCLRVRVRSFFFFFQKIHANSKKEHISSDFLKILTKFCMCIHVSKYTYSAQIATEAELAGTPPNSKCCLASNKSKMHEFLVCRGTSLNFFFSLLLSDPHFQKIRLSGLNIIESGMNSTNLILFEIKKKRLKKHRLFLKPFLETLFLPIKKLFPLYQCKTIKSLVTYSFWNGKVPRNNNFYRKEELRICGGRGCAYTDAGKAPKNCTFFNDLRKWRKLGTLITPFEAPLAPQIWDCIKLGFSQPKSWILGFGIATYMYLNFRKPFIHKIIWALNIKMYLSMKGCLLAYIKLRDFLEKISQPETVLCSFTGFMMGFHTWGIILSPVNQLAIYKLNLDHYSRWRKVLLDAVQFLSAYFVHIYPLTQKILFFRKLFWIERCDHNYGQNLVGAMEIISLFPQKQGTQGQFPLDELKIWGRYGTIFHQEPGYLSRDLLCRTTVEISLFQSSSLSPVFSFASLPHSFKLSFLLFMILFPDPQNKRNFTILDPLAGTEAPSRELPAPFIFFIIKYIGSLRECQRLALKSKLRVHNNFLTGIKSICTTKRKYSATGSFRTHMTKDKRKQIGNHNVSSHKERESLFQVMTYLGLQGAALLMASWKHTLNISLSNRGAQSFPQDALQTCFKRKNKFVQISCICKSICRIDVDPQSLDERLMNLMNNLKITFKKTKPLQIDTMANLAQGRNTFLLAAPALGKLSPEIFLNNKHFEELYLSPDSQSQLQKAIDAIMKRYFP